MLDHLFSRNFSMGLLGKPTILGFTPILGSIFELHPFLFHLYKGLVPWKLVGFIGAKCQSKFQFCLFVPGNQMRLPNFCCPQLRWWDVGSFWHFLCMETQPWSFHLRFPDWIKSVVNYPLHENLVNKRKQSTKYLEYNILIWYKHYKIWYHISRWY